VLFAQRRIAGITAAPAEPNHLVIARDGALASRVRDFSVTLE
jgi:hypothetical protein